MTTLLGLVQAVCSELGLPQPTTVVSSSDAQVTQIYSFVKRLGRDLTSDYEWQVLNRQYLFTTTTTVTTGTYTTASTTVVVPSTSGITTDYGVSGDGFPPYTNVSSITNGTDLVVDQFPLSNGTAAALTLAKMRYALPTDWQKEVNQTEWDRTNRWPLSGPKSAQEWQFLQGGIVSTGPRLRFRIHTGKIELNPVPGPNITLALEYQSTYWVLSSAGTAKAAFTADDDTCVYDDSLMILGTKMLWRQEKGFESSIAERDFRVIRDKLTAQNQAAPVLSMANRPATILLTMGSIPDGNWPSG